MLGHVAAGGGGSGGGGSARVRRRRGSATFAAAVLVLLLSAAAAEQPATAGQQQPAVIIIGAGLAGITAARRLADAGVPSLVVEARERPGGRLHSVPTATPGGERVDLGGMWPHNYGPRCALTPLIEGLGLNVSRRFNYIAGQVLTADGAPASAVQYTSAYAAFQREVRGEIDALRARAAAAAAAAAAGKTTSNTTSTSLPAGSRLPVAAVPDEPIAAIYERFLARHRPAWRAQERQAASLAAAAAGNSTAAGAGASNNDSAANITTAETLADLVMNANMQTLLNANITALSALRFGDAKVLPAVDVLVRGGFDGTVTRQLAGLNVSYGTVVTNVSQDADGVVVTTSNGTKLRAPFALVTLPLGVLKARDVAFSPPLPAAKLAAIDAMGFGVLDKVVLVYRPEDVFWNGRGAGGGGGDGRVALPPADFLAFATRDGWSGRWSSWLNYQAVLGQPVLVALNAAATAEDLERRGDAAVVAEALAKLQAAYGASWQQRRQQQQRQQRPSNTTTTSGGAAEPPPPPLPRPVQAIVTRWRADPFARGSYSYFAVGNPRSITDDVAAPFGRVLFAGEAASPKPGTAEGAFISGRREAARLVRLLLAGGGGDDGAAAAAARR